MQTIEEQINHNQEFYSLLGLLLYSACEVEFRLSAASRAILTDLDSGTKQVLFAPLSFRNLQDIFFSLAKKHCNKEELESLRKDVARFEQERNRFVHSEYIVYPHSEEDSKPNLVDRVKRKTSGKKGFKIETSKETIEEIKVVINLADKIMLDLSATLKGVVEDDFYI